MVEISGVGDTSHQLTDPQTRLISSYLVDDVVKGLLQFVVGRSQLPEISVCFQDGDDQLVDFINCLIQASLGKRRLFSALEI